MSSKLKAIGVYGGTFDPIHLGHLRPALEVAEKFQLDHIRFIPSSIPPHRDSPKCSSQWRIKLIEQAIAKQSRFKLDTREINRPGLSFMIDTLESIRNDFPSIPLCLILGLDAFLNLDTWYRWNELLNYCHIIITQRPTHQFSSKEWPESIATFYSKHKLESASLEKQITMLHNSLCGKLALTEVTQLAISSSDIRHRVKNNLSIQYLTPEPVKLLISQNNLYKSIN